MKEIDIINCEDEQIHKIGSVQSRGLLIGINIDSKLVEYVSENFQNLIENRNVLGKKLDQIDRELDLSHSEESFLNDYFNICLKSNDLINSFETFINGVKYHLISYQSGKHLIFELEPVLENNSGLSENILGGVVVNVNSEDESLNQSLGKIADQIRKLLDFDRVMIYNFHEDWHGEVIAESKINSLESFLGLHYPATDIPAQARELYKLNLTRLISDVNSEPSPILSNIKTPLDLTNSEIRAVSPVHIQYLKNMKVGASFSISILSEGELWGLIACHNNTNKTIDFKQRKSVELIAFYIGALVSNLNQKKIQLEYKKATETLDNLDKQMRLKWDIISGLTFFSHSIVDLFECSGAAIILDGKITLVGNTPKEEDILNIVNWISSNKTSENLFHTNHLSSFIDEAVNYADVASGLLAIELSKELNSYLIWFRAEQIEKVTWAGRDEKQLVKIDENKFSLSPRNSFDSWEEEVRNTSVTWQKSEIKIAYKLKDYVLLVKQLKSNEIEILNKKLEQAYSDLDSFSYTLSHDLKTPLNTIRGYLELYIEEENIKDNPFLNKAFESTASMAEMIDDILNYSKLGRENIKKESFLVHKVCEEVKEQMFVTKKFENLTINIPENIALKANKLMMRQVFTNLIDNAIKYKHPRRDAEVKIDFFEDENVLEFIVRDNGIGIDVNNFDKIFNLFHRVQTSQNGSGIGLAIVKKIILNHGGVIRVESKLDEGTSFHILIPKVK